MITAEWTGGYPSLCFGEWIIKSDEKILSIPEDINGSSMNTKVKYRSWSFDGDYIEEWSDEKEAGSEMFEWLENNICWIDIMFDDGGVDKNQENYSQLYNAIQKEDFVTGSCGGCI